VTERVQPVSITDDDVLTAHLYNRLLRFAAVVDPLNPDPADLVQEAVARTLRKQHLTDLRDPEPFLARVIVRLASNRRRHFIRTGTAMARVAAELQVSSPSSDGFDSGAATALLALNARDRALLYLRVVEGRPFAEAAQVVGISETAARQRVSRAMARLRSHYAEDPRIY